MLPHFKNAFLGDEHRAFHWGGGRHAALLVHGFPGTPAEMHPLAMHLHELGWTVRGPLLPGFGPEIETLAQRSCDEWLATIHNALDELRQSHERVIVIGFSLGGALTVQAAAAQDVHALILLAPFWQIDHVLWQMLPVLRFIFPKIKPFQLLKLDFSDADTRTGITNFMPGIDLDDPEVQHQIRNFAIPIELLHQIRLAGQRCAAAAPAVEKPALIVQGRYDETVRPHHTRQLLQRFSGPVQYVEVDADHNLLDHTTTAWRQIQQTISDFLITS